MQITPMHLPELIMEKPWGAKYYPPPHPYYTIKSTAVSAPRWTVYDLDRE